LPVNCAANVVLHCQDLHESPGAIGPSYDSFAALALRESPPLLTHTQLILHPFITNCAASVILPC